MVTRSILGLMYTMQGLRQLGEDPAPVLGKYGLDLDKLDPSAQIDRALELRIHAEMAERLHDPLAGLKAGQFFGFTGYGPLAMLLLTCADTEEAIRIGVRYQRLTYLYCALEFEPGEKLSAVVLTPMPLPPRAFRFRVDGEVSGTVKLMQDIQTAIGVNLRPESIDMPYPRPREAQSYERHFGCPVRFGGRQARIWIRNEHLHLRFPTHDPAAHALYRGLCDQQLLQQQNAVDNFAQKVLLHLDLFRDKLPGAARVARFFGMPERSFRRRLSEEGTSFRALVNDARFRRAQHLLRDTSLTVEAVAEQLGYAEPAAFIHAFRRWAGMAPMAFRHAGAMAARRPPASPRARPSG
ncbi:MAG: AraC family transcriptional regulator [Nevskia sp.]|nr:AraC family transcriptional regulator [Nevskia sp.]